jgi:hypothetical protein
MFSIFNKIVSKPVDFEKVNFTAIVSTGRTGTNYLGELINKPKLGFVATHEPAPNFEKLCVDFFLKKVSFDETAKLVKEQRTKILHKAGDKNYVESNGNLTFLLPVLNAVFPNLKVVHIVRNPIDFVISGVNRPEIRNGVKVQKYLFEENWLLKSSHIEGDLYQNHWAQMDVYERFMWTWAFKNQYLADYVENHGGLTLRFEDMFVDKARAGLLALFDYIGLRDIELQERDLAAKNRSTVDQAEKYGDWPDERKHRIREICGPLAARWNYEL